MARPREIEAFSLYWHWTQKHWQMNVRRKGEPGWDITHIPDEQAQAIFSMLETSGHPDGPWSVKQVETWKSLDGPALEIQVHAFIEPIVLKAKGVVNVPEDVVKIVAVATGSVDWLGDNVDRRFTAIPDDLFAPGLYDDSLKPFLALLADWKLVIAENTEARNGLAR